jgi:hypothetical protein
MSPDLNVVKKSKGPVMTTIDEFYKVGPGPSSSHTIGPMRITYDFYNLCSGKIRYGRKTVCGNVLLTLPSSDVRRSVCVPLSRSCWRFFETWFVSGFGLARS